MEFKVGPVELEFAVELRADAKVKAGFKAWVVSGDAEGGVARGRTHRVKFVLTPQRPGGGDLLGVAQDGGVIDVLAHLHLRSSFTSVDRY